VDDEVGKPLWGVKDTGRSVLSAAEVARQAGVSEDAMKWAIGQMLERGTIIQVFSPLCPRCGTVIDEYASPDDIPLEVECPGCGQQHHVSELDLRVGYSVVDRDK
jgi:hypothetical protein